MTQTPPEPPTGSRPSTNRTRSTTIAVVAAALVGILVGALGMRVIDNYTPRRTAAPAPVPSPSAPGIPASTPGSTSSVGCEPGASGPLRGDLSITNPRDGSPVPYSVSLPADYDTACKTYPVLYVLHGKTDSNASFLPAAESVRSAVQAGVLPDVVIITPDGFYDQRWEGQGETNFIDALIPYVEQTYRVDKGPSFRLLAGFSMGGHGAFRFAVKYPKMFTAVWSVDAAMADNDAYLQYVDQVKADKPQLQAVGGKLNGYRVTPVIDAFKAQGVDIPYTYNDVDHTFPLFVQADEQAGYPAMKFLTSNLGRPM